MLARRLIELLSEHPDWEVIAWDGDVTEVVPVTGITSDPIAKTFDICTDDMQRLTMKTKLNWEHLPDWEQLNINAITESIENNYGLTSQAVKLISVLEMDFKTECFNSQYVQTPIEGQDHEPHYNGFDSCTEEGKNFRHTLIAMAITQPEDMRP